jgi:hypothetical protein
MRVREILWYHLRGDARSLFGENTLSFGDEVAIKQKETKLTKVFGFPSRPLSLSKNLRFLGYVLLKISRQIKQKGAKVTKLAFEWAGAVRCTRKHQASSSFLPKESSFSWLSSVKDLETNQREGNEASFRIKAESSRGEWRSPPLRSG